jgi:hypothetical protein
MPECGVAGKVREAGVIEESPFEAREEPYRGCAGVIWADLAESPSIGPAAVPAVMLCETPASRCWFSW